MIYDRATRLLPTERAVALCLAVAVLHSPDASHHAAHLLCRLILATSASEVYGATYDAVMFATGVICP